PSSSFSSSSTQPKLSAASFIPNAARAFNAIPSPSKSRFLGKELLKIGGGKERLVDQALTNGVKIAVCSTSNEKAVSAIVSCLLGPERAEKIKIFAGDVVPKKKPDPAIYNLAAETLGVDPSKCVVVEDSAIGLAAAKAAGMTCIVTKNGYTTDEDFVNADAVFDCIGDPPEERFDLAFCGSLLQKQLV
ncbi:unnamed protein product, partial [Brassica rapa subsp. trilocularis]